MSELTLLFTEIIFLLTSNISNLASIAFSSWKVFFCLISCFSFLSTPSCRCSSSYSERCEGNWSSLNKGILVIFFPMFDGISIGGKSIVVIRSRFFNQYGLLLSMGSSGLKKPLSVCSVESKYASLKSLNI